jgi:predicted nuclease of predicted toxin-antitoxin system
VKGSELAQRDADLALRARARQILNADGDTAQHAHEVAGAGASDHEVMQHAIDRGAVIITADTDFGALLVHGRRTEPSVILVRELQSLPVASQGRLLVANLDQIREVLITGAIVVFLWTTSASGHSPLRHTPNAQLTGR